MSDKIVETNEENFVNIKLNKESEEAVVFSIQKYMQEEFEIEVGEMQAGFLLNYFLQEIGPFVYNKAINDAELFFSDKLTDLSINLYEEELTFWKKR